MSDDVTLTEKDSGWLDDLVERGEHPDRQAALDAVLKAAREAWVYETIGRMVDEAEAEGPSDATLDDIWREVLARHRVDA
jgi:Arc/MetJ-type ribon-helix-helix transcriptional regulator